MDITRVEEPKHHGKPGDCDLCGEWSGELVDDVCPACRDKYGITCEAT